VEAGARGVEEELGAEVKPAEVTTERFHGRSRRAAVRCLATGEAAVLGRIGGCWSESGSHRAAHHRSEARGSGGWTERSPESIGDGEAHDDG
jgi:hypothetical protein